MNKNVELWDILDKDGRLTGRTVEKGRPLKEGEYHLIVHIWIRNSKGDLFCIMYSPLLFLIQI